MEEINALNFYAAPEFRLVYLCIFNENEEYFINISKIGQNGVNFHEGKEKVTDITFINAPGDTEMKSLFKRFGNLGDGCLHAVWTDGMQEKHLKVSNFYTRSISTYPTWGWSVSLASEYSELKNINSLSGNEYLRCKEI